MRGVPAPIRPTRPPTAPGVRRSRWMLLVPAAVTLAVAAVWLLFGRGGKSAPQPAFAEAAQTALRERRWPELEAISARWTAAQPRRGDAWIAAAEAAYGQGDVRRAADRLARVPDSDPRCVPALLQRVDMLFEQVNAPKAAAETCRRILKLDPSVGIARQRLAYFDAMSLRRGELVRSLREAIRLRQEPREAYVYVFLADWLYFKNGDEVVEGWLKAAPDDEDFLVARAYHLAATMNRVDVGPAAARGEELMAECRRRFPRNPEVLAYFARAAIERADLEAVTDVLAAVPPEAAGDCRFWVDKGWCHDARDEFAEAEAAFRKAIALNPYDWRARQNLAKTLRRTGDADEAVRQATLADDGARLTLRLTALPSPQAADVELLKVMADYADAVGDPVVSDGLRFRLATAVLPPVSPLPPDRKATPPR